LINAGIENATIAFVAPTHLPYKDGQFDAVCCQSTLGRVTDRGSVLAEIRRVLRGAGRLSTSEFLGDPNFSPRSTAESVVEAAGFEILERFGNVVAYTINFRKPLESRPSAFGMG
jgi:ubiquinone/menaquinone biosynthesis C-methylase UbiE